METSEDAELCFPQLLNASCVRPTRRRFDDVLTYVLLFSLSLLTVFLNLLVTISISHFKQLHTPTNLLLLSLAVSDAFVGLLWLFQIMLIDGCWFLGDLMCSMYQYLDYIVSSTSVGTVVLISVDRYVAICDPLRYPVKVTQRRVQVCVCLCWICSVTFQTLVLMDNLHQPGRFNSCVGECVIVISDAAGLADVVFSFIAPITVIVVLYVRVFVAAVTQARAARRHVAPGKVTAKRSELKAARTLGVLVAVFLLCFCPFYCVSLSSKDDLMSTSASAVVICLYSLNACLNPIIYAFLYPWFRKSVKCIVTLQILQPDSSEANVL